MSTTSAHNDGFAIGVDIGGTFTDAVLIEADGTVHIAKGLSTPEAFERGILRILQTLLEQIKLPAENCNALVHGTTVATNAIIERKGALTGLITTKGFRDVLELRRIRVPRLYDLTWEKPLPLVERYLREEVVERIAHDGSIHTALDPESVRQALARLRHWNVTSIAVCLINAYANPAHEETVRSLLREEAPEIDVSISSEILREMREYERTSTTVINAYVMPVVKRYVASLRAGLTQQGFRSPLLMMQSNGGVMTAEVACEKPVHIIESGPAAGVVAALNLARETGYTDAVALDIGGTTAKASLIERGKAAYSNEYEVGGGFSRSGKHAKGGGYALRAPTLDISEIGAGGGSIVWLDDGGVLQVGPQSAGASPGPACYGRGGTEPTLTDACLLLGYLDPAGLAGGSVQLDVKRAEASMRERVATHLGMDITELCFGVFRIAVSNMTRAIRSVSTERGKDPRDFTLIAFGGNGGLFAAAIARELELPRVIIPPASGILSAFGLLFSDLEHHFTQTMLGRTERLDAELVESRWQRLEAEALQTLAREGYPRERCRLQRFGEVRYYSQTQELAVPWPEGPTTPASLPLLASAFEDAHERTYGHRGRDGIVELVNLHLIASGVADRPRVPQHRRFAREHLSTAGERQAYFGQDHGWHTVRSLARAALGPKSQDGPLIVQEFDATVLVPPDYSVTRDAHENLVMQRMTQP